MPFEKLPNELIAKIFKCLLIDSNGGPGSESIEANAWKEDMSRLRLVCKRFNSIINYELQELLDFNDRFPRFRASCTNGSECVSSSPHHGPCDLDGCDEQCSHVRDLGSFKYIKLRALVLVGDALFGCFPRYFNEQTSSFSNIDQLDICVCQIDLNVFDMIIRSLPNLKMLSIGFDCYEHACEPLDDIEMTSLKLDRLVISDDCCEQLYEYVIRSLPARQVIFRSEHYQRDVDREWADRYLIQHKDVVRTSSLVNYTGYWFHR